MPVYTCTTVESTLSTDVKTTLAGEGVTAERVMVVFESSPAHFAVEAGRVWPEPGHEAEWIGSHASH